MHSTLEFIRNNISIFDLIAVLLIIYSMAQCSAKGFTLSLLSFSKWLIALVITIVVVPKLSPLTADYIESQFISDIAIGIFTFIVALFIIINISKAISSAITWSGLGVVDKTFGLVFGIFKGYVICVCIFTLLNWFYPLKNWVISTDESYFFPIIYNGSEFLIKEFPNRQDYLDETKKKVEDI